MKKEKIKLCLQIISGLKTCTEMTDEEFVMLFNEKIKYFKNRGFPDQREVVDRAVCEISELLYLIDQK